MANYFDKYDELDIIEPTQGAAYQSAPQEVRDAIDAAVRQYPGISPNDMAAIARVESNFNPKAVGKPDAQGRTAKGLWQFLDSTAKAFKLDDPFDVPSSTMAAAEHLHRDMERGRTREEAIQAYNRGPNKWQYDTPEGKAYLAKVLGYANAPVITPKGLERATARAKAEAPRPNYFDKYDSLDRKSEVAAWLESGMERANAAGQAPQQGWRRFAETSGLGTFGKLLGTGAAERSVAPGSETRELLGEAGKIMRSGGLGSLLQSVVDGKFSPEARKIYGDLLQFKKEVADGPVEAFKKLGAAIEDDPSGFAGEVFKSLYQDPWLAGLTSLPRALARKGAMIGVTASPGLARLGQGVGAGIGAGVMGGLALPAIEAAKQLDIFGYIKPESLAGPAYIGAGGGFVLGLTSGLWKAPDFSSTFRPRTPPAAGLPPPPGVAPSGGGPQARPQGTWRPLRTEETVQPGRTVTVDEATGKAWVWEEPGAQPMQTVAQIGAPKTAAGKAAATALAGTAILSQLEEEERSGVGLAMAAAIGGGRGPKGPKTPETRVPAIDPVTGKPRIKLEAEAGEKVEQGELKSDQEGMLDVMGQQMYTSGLGAVATKELFQNSFDAVKAEMFHGRIDRGQIDIKIDRGERTITITDNGIGMSPETVREGLLKMFGSIKAGLPPHMRSGGFGVAKMAFLLGSEWIDVTTINEGVRTRFKATSDDIRKKNFQIGTKEVDEPNGTVIVARIPETYIDPRTEETRSIYMPYDPSDIPVLKMLIGNVDVTWNGKVYEIGASQDLSGYRHLPVEFDWGNADVYFGSEKKQYPSHKILSAGIYQFDHSFYKNDQYDHIPYDIVVNVKPGVDAHSMDYPFTTSREAFRGQLKEDIDAMSDYLKKIARGESAKEIKNTFETFSSMPRVGSTEQVTTAKAIPLRPGATFSAEEQAAIDALVEGIRISAGEAKDAGGNVVGQSERLKPKSFRAKIAATDPKDLMKEMGGIDPNDPIFHNNTNVDWAKEFPNSEVIFAKFGTVFVDALQMAGQIWTTLVSEPRFAGVSIDKTYRGIKITVPYDGFFVNPLATTSNTIDGVTEGVMHAIEHEIAHHLDMQHGDRFVGKIADINEALADKGFLRVLRQRLTEILDEHINEYADMRAMYDRSSTTNIAKSLEGSRLAVAPSVRGIGNARGNVPPGGGRGGGPGVPGDSGAPGEAGKGGSGSGTGGLKALAVGATGLGALQLFGEDDDGELPYLVAAGMFARSGPGGRWHPAAVHRISTKLKAPLGLDGVTLQGILRDIQGSERGNISPETIKALKLQLETKIAQAERIDQMVARYLNRHGALESDPLKDIPLPDAEGAGAPYQDLYSKTWGEAFNRMVQVAPAAHYQPGLRGEPPSAPLGHIPNAEKIPPGEPIFRLEVNPTAQFGTETREQARQRGLAAYQIASYVAHAGDYMKNDVPLERLAKYDFVTLIKEVAAIDAKMQEAMRAAARAKENQLPTVRRYKDGMKWTEYKAPEKLTPAQAKTVKKITIEEFDKMMQDYPQLVYQLGGRMVYPNEGLYIPLDAKGKPIMNLFKREQSPPMPQPTPELAWLSGRMTEEGNRMGNCTSTYCGDMRGEGNQVYSLQDNEGNSFAVIRAIKGREPWKLGSGGTIWQSELNILEQRYPGLLQDYRAWHVKNYTPTKATRFGNDFWEFLSTTEPEIYAALEKENAAVPRKIEEIKYQANKTAYDPRYGPYIRDFIRSQGPWSEVDEAGNAGLVQYSAGALKNLPAGLYTPREVREAELKGVPLKDFQQDLRRHNESVDVLLKETPDGPVELVNIALKLPAVRRSPRGWATAPGSPHFRGLGQNVLKEIEDWADANNKDLMALVKPWGYEPPPLYALEKVFRRHGFEPGPSQPYEDAVLMYRSPHAEAEGPRPEAVGESDGGAPPIHAAGNEVPPPPKEPPGGFWREEEGGIDPELAKTLAVIGAGGALLSYFGDPDNAIRNFAVGAIGAGAARGLLRSPKTKPSGADVASLPISNRAMDVGLPVWRRWNDMEYGIKARSAAATNMASDWAKFMNPIALGSLPKAARDDFTAAILTGNPLAVQAAIAAARNPALQTAWNKVRSMLDQIGAELVAAGRFKVMLTDYFPRLVKDKAGLLDYVGSQAGNALDALLADRARALGRPLTQMEESKIINDYLLRPMASGGMPGWARGRRIQDVTKEMLKFYEDPRTSLDHYIHSTATDLETAKFFGQDTAYINRGGVRYINVDGSIGNLVNNLRNSGRMSRSQLAELKEILEARLGPGEKPSRTGVQAIRDIGSTAYLPNPISGIGQLSDYGTIMYLHGVVNTLTSLSLAITGNAKLRPADIGLIDNLGEDLLSVKTSAKIFMKAAKYGGFAGPDQFMKAVSLTAARRKLESWAQTDRGRARIAREYGEAYGSDINQLIQDLRNRQLTPLTRSFFFGELSRHQPISKFEMTELYLRNPDPGVGPVDTRSAYHLKNWMLKQYGLVRAEIWKQMRVGNWSTAFRNAAYLLTLMGVSGASIKMLQDFVLGKPFTFEWEDIPLNMMKTFGLSQYVLDKVHNEEYFSAAGNWLAPPYRVFEDLFTKDSKEMIQYVPGLGKFVFNEEWSSEGQAKGEDKRLKEALRDVDRQHKPWIGAPEPGFRDMVKEQKRNVRDANPTADERVREQRRKKREQREEEENQ